MKRPKRSKVPVKIKHALIYEGNDDYRLISGQFWLTARNKSLWIRKTKTAIRIEVYPLGKEAELAPEGCFEIYTAGRSASPRLYFRKK